MTGFIVNCVNDKVFPMPTNESQLSQLEAIYAEMNQKLEKIVMDRESIIRNDAKSHPNSQENILKYLEKVGKSNEYMISNDLGIPIEETYETLCYLKIKGILQLTEGLEWKLSK